MQRFIVWIHSLEITKYSERYFVCMKKQINMKTIRLVLILLLVCGVFVVTTAFSMAWYTGVTTNKNNRMTTGTVSVKLLTTNRPIQVVSPDGSETTAPPFPKTTGELFLNDNKLIVLDDNENATRKFFEMNGSGEISGVTPNFRLQRPLIISNESESPVNYSIDFLCREVEKQGLGSCTYFNYTKIGEDIPNEELMDENQTQLSPHKTVENLAMNISRIGDSAPVPLAAYSSHIYIIDMGILPTAGNVSQGAGIELDIILATSQGVNAVHSINDQASFEKAIVNNKGGETFLLTKSVSINKALRSNNIFNLDLNGNTLTFEEDGMLEVFYPITQASMDIGSDKGGKIINANTMIFIGYQNKSALNWYTDITGIEQPAVCTNVLVRQRIVENGSVSSGAESKPSSEPTSSIDDYLPDYKDYEKITIASGYESGDGSKAEPYQISTIEQFKYFIEDETVSKAIWYQLTNDIANIKNVPEKLIDKEARLILLNNAKIMNLDITFKENPTNPNLLLSKLVLNEVTGTRIPNEQRIKNITYRVK